MCWLRNIFTQVCRSVGYRRTGENEVVCPLVTSSPVHEFSHQPCHLHHHERSVSSIDGEIKIIKSSHFIPIQWHHSLKQKPVDFFFQENSERHSVRWSVKMSPFASVREWSKTEVSRRRLLVEYADNTFIMIYAKLKKKAHLDIIFYS